MAKIDIRDQSAEDITVITFGDSAHTDERYDIANEINVTSLHDDYIFFENGQGEFIPVRKTDVGNLIKALQKAQEIWGGVE